MEKTSFELWLSVNEEGGAAVSLDSGAEAVNALMENSGGEAIRTVKLTVTMTPPEVAEVDVDVPDEAGDLQQVEAKAA